VIGHRPRLAEDDFAPSSPAGTPDVRHPASLQTGFLTADYCDSLAEVRSDATRE
jgi:hypothetical protein